MKIPRIQLYIAPLLIGLLLALVTLFVIGHFFTLFYLIAWLAMIAFAVLIVFEVSALFAPRKLGVTGKRVCPTRFSNGDHNDVEIYITNKYKFGVNVEVYDELPPQLQIRDFCIKTRIKAGETYAGTYSIKPLTRGEYHFGLMNVLVQGPLSLCYRRFQLAQPEMVRVYPSFIQMRRYEFLAISNHLTDAGLKKIRKISNNNEFEHIRNYVKGDDFRTINWKASARRNEVMVNQYQDEKSQAVYNIIDMGRSMKMPFEGMTLLDYAINAALVMSNTAILKQDKAGLICTSNAIQAHVPAARQRSHMHRITESLYNLSTQFAESDLELLHAAVKTHIKQRSLLIFYTNFEAISSMRRQLRYFRALRQYHLLVVVFFANTEINQLLHDETHDMVGIFDKIVAERFAYEKHQIVLELKQYGIQAILTEPDKLTVNVLNKYLELKARGYI